MARGEFMKNLTGWQIVALVGIMAATLVLLVWMGQDVGAMVGAGLLIASALGANVVTSVAQNTANSEKLTQVKDLANGNLDAIRKQMDVLQAQHAQERQVLLSKLQESNDRAVYLAAMVPSDKAGEVNNG